MVSYLTHIGYLWQIRHRFINLWQICHRFSSVTPSSQMTFFSGPDFVLIQSASLLLPIVHTLTISLSRKSLYQQDYQPRYYFGGSHGRWPLTVTCANIFKESRTPNWKKRFGFAYFTYVNKVIMRFKPVAELAQAWWYLMPELPQVCR